MTTWIVIGFLAAIILLILHYERRERMAEARERIAAGIMLGNVAAMADMANARNDK